MRKRETKATHGERLIVPVVAWIEKSVGKEWDAIRNVAYTKKRRERDDTK